MFALIDCNNFFVSCERVFRPDLMNKPVIVLSNNDGCAIARSNEAKALGIKMGEPYFRISALCQKYNVQVFSSNFALYGDFSDRVMSIIQSNWPQVEVYSIDEAFLDLSSLPEDKIADFCATLRSKILRWTGIPTSVGIGTTKTLAKAANFIAKKKLATPVFYLANKNNWLSQLDVNDIWGIGRQWSKKLKESNIQTASDLLNSNAIFIKKNVVLLRIIKELQGISCLTLNDITPKKSIVSSASFGILQTELTALKEAASSHCKTAWSKMRKQKSCAQYISVCISSNRFRDDLPQYANTSAIQLIHATDDLRELTRQAINCLEKIYKNGVYYQKCGVLFSDVTNKNHQQLDMFSEISEAHQENSDKLMNVIESINHKYGRQTIHLAAEGINKNWAMKHESKTPCYTTRWSELPTVFA